MCRLTALKNAQLCTRNLRVTFDDKRRYRSGVFCVGGVVSFHEGDILVMKKPHPCGSFRFKCMRAGSDVRIICEGCGRDVTVLREKLERSIKSVIPAGDG